jgi:hypothetical protein
MAIGPIPVTHDPIGQIPVTHDPIGQIQVTHEPNGMGMGPEECYGTLGDSATPPLGKVDGTSVN